MNREEDNDYQISGLHHQLDNGAIQRVKEHRNSSSLGVVRERIGSAGNVLSFRTNGQVL